MTWRDSYVAWESPDGKYVVTTPNMASVPQPVYGAITVTRQWDGHFGIHDPICWLQAFIGTTRWRYLVAIARKPGNKEDPRLPIWIPLVPAQIKPVKDSSMVKGFGVVSEDFVERLKPVVLGLSRRVNKFRWRRDSHPELEYLETSMREAFDRLSFPSSPRDLIRQVACVQRYWLLTDAWLEFHVHITGLYKFESDPQRRSREKPRNDLMGGFTTVPEVAQNLFKFGVPVWFMRYPNQFQSCDHVREIVEATAPAFPTDNGLFPSSPIYDGWAGEKHFAAIMIHAHAYMDLETTPFPAATQRPERALPASESAEPSARGIHIAEASSSSLTVPTADSRLKKPPRSRPCKYIHQHQMISKPKTAVNSSDLKTGPSKNKHPQASSKPSEGSEPRDKFQDFQHAFFPPCIPVWQSALRNVDQSRAAPSRKESWRYWVPDAVVVVGSAMPDRLQRYTRNWLRARTAWYWILTHDAMKQRDLRPLVSQEWREYLNVRKSTAQDMTTGTETAIRKRVVVQFFQIAFGVDSIMEEEGEPRWFGEPWTGTPQQMQELAWELCEVGFRAELTELDSHLVPPSALEGENSHVTEVQRRDLIQRVCANRPFIPTAIPKKSEGIAADDMQDRAASLEALRRLMCRWPGVPDRIKSFARISSSTPQHELLQVEKALAAHYVQTFWEVSGRAATIPRKVPVAI